MIHLTEETCSSLDELVRIVEEKVFISISYDNFYSMNFKSEIEHIFCMAESENKIINIVVKFFPDKLDIDINDNTLEYMEKECCQREYEKDEIIKDFETHNELIIMNEEYFGYRHIETTIPVVDFIELLKSTKHELIENNETGLYMFGYIFRRFGYRNARTFNINVIFEL